MRRTILRKLAVAAAGFGVLAGSAATIVWTAAGNTIQSARGHQVSPPHQHH